MPNLAFLWEYTPVFRPFNPLVAGDRDTTGTATFQTFPRAATLQSTPHQEAPVTLASDQQPMFGGDFYERIHVTSLIFALGNLVGDQTREMRVWNAYRRVRVLETLTLIDGEGITVSGQPNPPLQFAPLQERVYSLEITTEGPPTVEASLVYDFDEGDSITILITGSRVTPWSWAADWDQGIGESLEWLTEITESEDSNEQASALRLLPRRAFEFGIFAEGQARQAMESAIAGWAGRVWALPIWPDAVPLDAQLPIGSTLVNVPTTGRDFAAGSLAMFLGDTWRDYEVVEVLNVNAASVELKRPTARAWAHGTPLYPARTARLDDGATVSRFTGQAHTGRARFDIEEPCDWPELAGLPLYRGLPVLEDQPEWSQEPTLALQRKLAIRDNRYGPRNFTDRADVPVLRQAHRWSAVGRAQLARIRSLLYLLKGKHAAIWVPSWVDDFTLTANAASTSTALDVAWQGYALFLNGIRNRRDVRISTPTSIQYARIGSAVEVDANTERLSIDTPLTTDLTPENTTLQYLTLWRSDTDRFEFAWWCGDMGGDQATADIPMPMRTFRHDL